MWGRQHRPEREVEHPDAAPRNEPVGATPCLARDAVLLSIDPDSGKVWKGAWFVAPAALMAELVHLGRVGAVEDGAKVRLSVLDAAPLDDKYLDAALRVIESGLGGRKVRKLTNIVPQTPEVLKGLVENGDLVEETKRFLGVKVHRYRPAPGSRHTELARAVKGVLTGEIVPDERTALLVSVLIDIDAKLFVEHQDLKQARRRVDELRDGLPEGEKAVVLEVRQAMIDERDTSAGT